MGVGASGSNNINDNTGNANNSADPEFNIGGTSRANNQSNVELDISG